MRPTVAEVLLPILAGIIFGNLFFDAQRANDTHERLVRIEKKLEDIKSK